MSEQRKHNRLGQCAAELRTDADDGVWYCTLEAGHAGRHEAKVKWGPAAVSGEDR